MQLPEILISYVLKKEYDIDNDDILGIYQYGSRVYGTAAEKSDWDFVVITKSANLKSEYSSDNLDIQLMDIDTYIHKLKEHDIMAMETYYSNIEKIPIREIDVDFVLDLPTLRKSVSSVCNNSFVKFKKKLTLENEDNYIGIKSLFHSLRIAELGRLIATGSEKVLETDTYLWERIKKDAIECNYDWETLHKIYKPLFNEAMTEFRLVAPKTPKGD